MADELISREAAKEEILAWARCITNPKYLNTEDAMFVLDNLPSVDAVKVVRCKDCEYFLKAEVNGNGFLICQVTDKEIFEDDFCSYGERKEENAD